MRTLAGDIEKAVCDKHDQGRLPHYTDQMRQLGFWLANAKNAELRKAVLRGRITPKALSEMNEDELTPRDQLKIIQGLRRAAEERDNETAPSGLPCPKCHKVSAHLHTSCAAGLTIFQPIATYELGDNDQHRGTPKKVCGFVLIPSTY